MREALAERLLAQVMQWTPEDIARERPILQAMAAFKYDEYQQFSPGMRFVESLALWLRQFEKISDREIAYKFIRDKLIFFSSAEITHLVSVTYSHHIRPLLIRNAAKSLEIADHLIAKIAYSAEFRILQRRCLFLGLSDGACIDVFRRSNPEHSHEQILQTYELTAEKARDMQSNLANDLKQIAGKTPSDEETKFCMIFLLDDFSGSGVSYLRRDNESNQFTGKIAKFYEQLTLQESGLSMVSDNNNLYVGVVFYIATDKSRLYLQELIGDLVVERRIEWGIQVVQTLTDDVSLLDSVDGPFLVLNDSYYDPKVENEHTRKGGSDVKRGFASCSLPVVLTHNTPNNSVFLLWANPELYRIRGLFPRISRHVGEP